jgi:catechol 2,3-dioxygenase-like lactoylglutathione lyase family enzyme
MLGDKEAVATLAVKDLGAARKFYEGVLGLKVTNAQGGDVGRAAPRRCAPVSGSPSRTSVLTQGYPTRTPAPTACL